MEGEEGGVGPAPAWLCRDLAQEKRSSHWRHLCRDAEAQPHLPPPAGPSGPPCPTGFCSNLRMSDKLHKSWI